MPQVIPFLVYVFLPAGSIYAAAAFLVVSYAVSRYQAVRAEKKARASYNAQLEDRKLTIRSAVAPRRVIYGRDRVGGPLKFAASAGDKGEFLYLIQELCEGPIEAIEKFYFNEIELPDPSTVTGFVNSGDFYKSATASANQVSTVPSNGTVTLSRNASSVTGISGRATGSGPYELLFGWAHTPGSNTVTGLPAGYSVQITYAYPGGKPLVRLRSYLGARGQTTDADLVAQSLGWTAQHRGDFTAYVSQRVEFDQDVFGQLSLPVLTALVKGRLVYDPRRNRMVSFNMEGARYAPTPALPTGWQMSTINGIQNQVVGKGVDRRRGLIYIDVRVFGLATATSSISLRMPADSNGAAASNGQTWGMRVSVERVDGIWNWSLSSRVQLVSIDVGGTAVQVASQILQSTPDDYECSGVITQSAAELATARLRLDYVSGQTYDCTLRITAPMLWLGAADPFAWSENAALCTADHLRDGLFGLEASALEVPDAEVIAAANICDENVVLNVGGATQRRYTVNGTIDTSVGPLDNLKYFEQAMAGSVVWVQGRWLISPGAWRAPTLTIDESSLADGPIKLTKAPSRANLFNAVRATFYDAAQGYVEVQAPQVKNPFYEAQDGGARLIRDVSYPLVKESLRAQRLAKVELERHRQATTIDLPTNLRGYNALPSRNVAVSLARYGFAAKPFEVRSRTQSSQGELRYQLQETAAAVYDWNYGEATTEDLAPNTNLPNPFRAPPTLTALAANSGTVHLQKMSDATLITRAYVTWNASTDLFVVNGGKIQVDWQVQGATAWQPTPSADGDAASAYIGPLADRTVIVIRARPVNASGRAGDWAYITHFVVGKLEPPINVVGLTAVVTYGAVLVSWTPNPEADYRRTELRVGGADWSTALFLANVSGSDYKWIWPPQATYTVWAKHFDTSGNDSDDAQSVVVVVDGRILINTGGLSAEIGGGNLLPNGSFERDDNLNGFANGWAIGAGGSGDTGRVVATTRPAGLRGIGVCQKLDITAVGNASDTFISAPPGRIGVLAGEKYTLSAYVRSNTTRPYLMVKFYNSSGLEIANPIGTALSVINTVQRLVHTVTAPASAVSAAVLLRGINAPGQSVEWDDVQFEPGDVVTAYKTHQLDAIPKIWRQAADPGVAAVNGDEWFDTDDKNKHYVREAGAWVSVRDEDITAALIAAANAQDTADGKITTFYQTTAPATSVSSIGDLWFDTNDGNRQYRYSGTAWIVATDTRVGQAINDAATAQSTADGKITTYFSTTAPGGTKALGDLWFNTADGRMYRWSGAAWVLQSTVGDGDIDTGNLALGAATRVVRTFVDRAGAATGTGSLVQHVQAFTALHTGIVVATAIVECETAFPGEGGSYVALALDPNYAGAGTPSASVIYGVSFIQTGTRQHVTISDTFNVTQGETYHVMIVSRGFIVGSTNKFWNLTLIREDIKR